MTGDPLRDRPDAAVTRRSSPFEPDKHMESVFERADTFDAFLGGVVENRELWHALAKRAVVPEGVAGRAQQLRRSWRLLVILEDWCGDAVNTVPMLARFAAETPSVELRVIRRDEHTALMDEHLTNGSRSIPILILLDDEYRERSCWGPRPQLLQRWFAAEGRALEKDARYREMRRWYARDGGRSTLLELIDQIERDEAA